MQIYIIANLKKQNRSYIGLFFIIIKKHAFTCFYSDDIIIRVVPNNMVPAKGLEPL